MKKCIFALLLVLAACSGKSPKKHVIDHSVKNQYMFVITANSGTLKGETLTLTSFPLVVYFSDLPHRVAGHIQLKDFVSHFGKEHNTTLSIVEGSKIKDIAFVLTEPTLKENKLHFKVKGALGKVPEKFGPSSLFLEISDYDDSSIADNLSERLQSQPNFQ